jgi:hypothetical protein
MRVEVDPALRQRPSPRPDPGGAPLTAAPVSSPPLTAQLSPQTWRVGTAVPLQSGGVAATTYHDLVTLGNGTGFIRRPPRNARGGDVKNSWQLVAGRGRMAENRTEIGRLGDPGATRKASPPTAWTPCAMGFPTGECNWDARDLCLTTGLRSSGFAEHPGCLAPRWMAGGRHGIRSRPRRGPAPRPLPGCAPCAGRRNVRPRRASRAGWRPRAYRECLVALSSARHRGLDRRDRLWNTRSSSA